VRNLPLDEQEIFNMVFQRWEKEWKERKNEQVATIYNEIVEIIARERTHIDEMIVALEIALQEALDVKVKMIRQEREMPTEVKG
jgi:predicted nucleotidyltransferase